MSTNIIVPELGESVVEATVAKWLKNEGDAVRVGEPVVELETEKVDLEVGAPHSGVLSRIARAQGADVKIGEVLGVIEESAEQAKAPASTGTTTKPAAPDTPKSAQPPSPGEPAPPTPPATQTAPPPSTPAAQAAPPAAAPSPAPATKLDKARATASAKRLADEHAVDLATVAGTGDSGRVTRGDVERHVGASGASEASGVSERTGASGGPGASGASRASGEDEARVANKANGERAASEATRPEERVKMSRRRQTIARRLVEAQRTAAMLTTFNEIDMSVVQDLRKRQKEAFKARHGVGLGLSGFFVKAVVAALKTFPRLNAEIQGDEMVLKRYYDIGIAVGASEGLVVPVLRDADRMTFAAIETAIKDFARKAEDGSLTLEDLRGGTFTITNGGVFGSLLSTPILNPPQVGILGLHKIEDRAVPVNGQVAIRPMMYVALSYDHRIVDGREAVQFLVRVKELVQYPESMLLEG